MFSKKIQRVISFMVVGFLVLGIQGCGSGDAPKVGNSVLGPDGGIFRGQDGVIIGAEKGTLTAPVNVFIETHEPGDSLGTIDFPNLPNYLNRVSNYYRLGASSDLWLSSDSPLLIGIPVPNDIESDNLAVAYLASYERTLDGDAEGKFWITLDGQYETETNLFLTTLPTLLAEGATVTLVKAVIEDVEEVIAPQVKSQATPGGNPEFVIRCTIEYKIFTHDFLCENNTAHLKQILETAEDALISMGFKLPELEREFSDLRSQPTVSMSAENPYKVALSFFLNCGWRRGNAGQYLAESNRLFLCYQDENTWYMDNTARHELFHAFQAAYIDGQLLKKDEVEWFVEGTAAFSGASIASSSIKRDNRPAGVEFPFQIIEMPLNKAAYSAQDFWVHLLKSNGIGIEFLETILKETSAHQDESDPFVLGTDAALQTLGSSLSKAYWEWVKDQAFERKIDIGYPETLNQCSLNNDTAPVASENSFDYTPNLPFPSQNSTLEPLSSKVFKVNFQSLSEADYSLSLLSGSESSALRVKYYSSGSASNDDCLSDEFEVKERSVSVKKGQNDSVIYALVSNTSTSEPISVNFKPSDVTIVEATGSISATVRDAVTADPISDVAVQIAPSSPSSTISEEPVGTYTVSQVPVGDSYQLTFTKPGYLDAVYSGVSVREDEPTFLEQLLFIDETYDVPANASGYITNAITGQGVSDINISLREGIGTTSGPIVTSTATGAAGLYSFTSLDAGYYSAEASKPGYITSHFTIRVIGNQANDNQNASISPDLPEDEWRIVLTWGATPSDLDSHLTGPALDSRTSRFHVFWYDRAYTFNGVRYVDLDVDDRFSYGPETVTIYQLTGGEGVYRYSVHDFSNRSSSYSTTLANSGAQVRVYQGGTLIRTYNVPNEDGTLWTVFELDFTQDNPIVPVNRMSYESSTEGVQIVDGSDADLIRSLPSK